MSDSSDSIQEFLEEDTGSEGSEEEEHPRFEYERRIRDVKVACNNKMMSILFLNLQTR